MKEFIYLTFFVYDVTLLCRLQLFLPGQTILPFFARYMTLDWTIDIKLEIIKFENNWMLDIPKCVMVFPIIVW